MRAVVVGAGSTGRRHLANLRTLAVDELGVVDVDDARAAGAVRQHRATRYATLEAALESRPDFAVIATPSHLHLPQALACARAGAHVFIEKPLATSVQGTADLIEELKRNGRQGMVGSNLRFDGVYAAVREVLRQGELGRVYAAQFYFGYDLKQWRPNVDYRTIYNSRRAEGGGVLLDVIHELDLALWWFGRARRVLSLPRRTGALAGDMEDIADLVVEFASGIVASLHLNYRDPIYRRWCSVSGDQGVVEADFAERTVRLRRARAEPHVERFASNLNEMYLRELQHFLAVIRGEERPRLDLEEDVRALQVALAARELGPVVEFPPPTLSLERAPVVIQARMGSSRLPGKVLMKTVGKTMLELLVERLRRARRVGRIIVATSDKPADSAIVAEAERLGIDWFRGSESDVLSRYHGAACQYGLEAVVRITADCPVLDPELLDSIIAKFLAERPDYCSNIAPRSVPSGLDVEIFTRATLDRIAREATDPLDREHVTRYIYQHPEQFECTAPAPYDENMAQRRWTLDTAADYEFLSTIFEELYPSRPDFHTGDIVALLERRPDLEARLHATP